MTDYMQISLDEALARLGRALNSQDANERSEVAARLTELFYRGWFTNPKAGEALLTALVRAEDKTKVIARRTAGVMEMMAPQAGISSQILGVRLLLMLNRPAWICGGEMGQHFADAAPVAEVGDRLLDFVESGPIDFQTIGAIVLGNYGPEAEAFLPRVLQMLSQYVTDCSRAPGLAYAAYMIGGLRPEVLLIFEDKILGNPHSCPHSREVAQTIFRMNKLQLPSVKEQ